MSTRRGFTLLELLLASGILAIMVGSIVSFSLLSDFTARRAETIAEVERVEEVLHRITRAVETADVIAYPPLSPASERTGTSLVLTDAVTRSQTVFLLSQGRIQVVEIEDGGTPSFFFLTPQEVLVTSLAFLHFGESGGSEGVSFAFRAENRATTISVQAGSYSRRFRATATLRPSLCRTDGDCSGGVCCTSPPAPLDRVGICAPNLAACSLECVTVANCPSPAPFCSAACEQKIPVCGNQDQNGDGDTNDPGEKGICLSTAAGPCPSCSFCGDGQVDEDGADNAPGLLAVDDDEDGTVDNASESFFPGSDDETCDDGCREPVEPTPAGCTTDCTTLATPRGCDFDCTSASPFAPPGCADDCDTTPPLTLSVPATCAMDCDTLPCDEGPPFNDHNACTNACRTAICGDGSVYFGEEECDDGNLVNGDGCDSQCKDEVVCAIARISIAFVIDASGSMQWDDRLKAAKAAVTKFVEYMDFPKDLATVVSFGDTATVRQALTANESDLKNAVNGLQPAGGTNIQHGLALAKAQLDAAISKVKIIILLTDGAPNRKNATSDPCTFAVPPSDDCGVIAEAASAKGAGIKIFSVGLGVDSSTELLLKEVANDPDATYYHFAPNAEEVLSVYGAISDAICPCNAGDLCDPAKGDADCATGFQCTAGQCRLIGQTGCNESNGNNYDGCTNACFTPVCGDGIKSVGLGEQCDDGGKCSGGANNGALCTKVNQVTVCGGGINCAPAGGDGCNATCRTESLCGNRLRESGERCDDGGQCVGGTKDGMACRRAWSDPPNADCPNGGTCVPESGDGCSSTCSSEWSPSPSYCRIDGEPCFADGDCNEPDSIVCGSCSGGDATTYRGYCIDGVKACAKSPPIIGTCPVPLCCNNVKEGYEECDDGMRCDAASGSKAGDVCAKDADCPGGLCRGFNLDGCTGTSDCVALVMPACGAMVRVGALAILAGFPPITAVIDAANGYAYFGLYGQPGKIAKVQLSNFSLAGTLTLEPGEDIISSASVIDTEHGFAYFGVSNPGRIVKIDLSTFSRVGILGVDATPPTTLSAAVIDETNTYAYFSSSLENPTRIFKIRLSDFTAVGQLSLDSGEANNASAVLANGYAYFSTYSAFQGKVVKVQLSDFSRVGVLSLYPGEAWAYAAVIDPAGYAYFGTTADGGGGAQSVTKIDLSTFTLAGRIGLSSLGSEGLSSAAINITNGFAYFGTADTGFPGAKVLKVRLSDFTHSQTLTLNADELNLASAVFDPSSGMLYFGTYGDSLVVKVDGCP